MHYIYETLSHYIICYYLTCFDIYTSSSGAFSTLVYVLLLPVLLPHKPIDIIEQWTHDFLKFVQSTVQHMIPVKTMVENTPDDDV
jgi:hypothetical protein